MCSLRTLHLERPTTDGRDAYKYSATGKPFQSAAIAARRSSAVRAAAGGGGSDWNDFAIQANATAAIASSMKPTPSSPKMILPMPNNVEYTATMPAIQFVQASAPPGVDSRPNPSRSDTRAQPGPPGR